MPSPLTRRTLHSGWQVRANKRVTRWQPAAVPGCVHTDLHQAGIIPDPFYGNNEESVQWIEALDWTYRGVFQVSADELASEHADLFFEGLDTLAEIRVNGQLVAQSENMFVPVRIAAKERLRPGKNTVEVRLAATGPYMAARKSPDTIREWNDPVGGCSLIRKEQCQYGWDWGPRFVTAGIWRPVWLECWSGNRIEHVAVRQEHGAAAVRLCLEPRTARPAAEKDSWRLRVLLAGRVVASAEGLTAEVPDPQLWWPVGQGAQPLYTVELELVREGCVVDGWSRRIGLRTIALDRHPDLWGESFQFVVNGRAIFAKGSNWIPAHSFLNEAGPEQLRALLSSAAACNHNMVRVWGGGVYETDAFYDCCDELGLLVWQDFMFACALYRGEEDEALYRQEAQSQVRRLAHHACLALWCGNNEVELIREIQQKETLRRAYDFLFNQLLPEVVRTENPHTPYWPSSPHTPAEYHRRGEPGAAAGDFHDWSIWHQLKPAEHFQTTEHRFCSEFGMQSYPHPELARTFCGEREMSISSRAMENHQKHYGGNSKILHYVLHYYPFPKDHTALVYLSQINQALCIRIGVEHWRRSQPRCMGALYWQLNDCWPVASWSSIDFGGRWKALQYASRRFYAPVLVTAVPDGAVSSSAPGNYFRNTIRALDLHTVCDLPEGRAATLRWTLFHVDGRRLRSGRRPVQLRPGESLRHERLDFAADLARHGCEQLLLRVRVEAGRSCLAENTALFTLPRFVHWEQAPIRTRLVARGKGDWAVEVSSSVPQHQVALELPGIEHHFEDNFFDLWPDCPRLVPVTIRQAVGAQRLRRALRASSLVHAVA